MEEQLRFAVCYWHSFAWPGGDPFGGETFMRPWHAGGDAMQQARHKADVAFELFRLLDVPFFTFHDRDIAPEGATLAAIEPQPARDRRGVRAEDALDRRAAAVGHGQPVLAPRATWPAPRPTPTRRSSPTPRRR